MCVQCCAMKINDGHRINQNSSGKSDLIKLAEPVWKESSRKPQLLQNNVLAELARVNF